MDAYDMSHKLAFAGRYSPVPFFTGPEFTNSVPGVPVLSMVRVFIRPQDWSLENVITIAKEISRALGPTQQFDVGMTLSAKPVYAPDLPAASTTARLTKLDPSDRRVFLRVSDGNGDTVYAASFPRLDFEPSGEDFWRSIYAPGAVKYSGQQ